MTRITNVFAAVALAAGLAACGQKNEAADTAAPAAAPTAATQNRGGMDTAPAAKVAKGSGTVTAVDSASITIDHGPIPEAGWPAMTMSFKASPDVAKQVKAGDKVAFDLKLDGAAGEVTAVRKQ